jgi:hypothetical protein
MENCWIYLFGGNKSGWRYDNYPFAFSKELNVSLYLYTFPTKLKSLEIRNYGTSKLLYPKERRKHRQNRAGNDAIELD